MDILFETHWFLVVNKPRDLLTQAVAGIDSVETRVRQWLRDRQPEGPNPFVGIPHRLDRMTTGTLVLARNQRALRRLNEQFAARRVEKVYHAIVLDSPQWDALSRADQPVKWTDWVRKIPDKPQGEICAPGTEGAREAVMHIRALDCVMMESSSCPLRRCEIRLETGRMHQIRLQLASRGSSILGDRLYGSDRVWMDGEFREPAISLHARSIAFYHPQTAERLEFVADYPADWERLKSYG
jgi:23S rRNA pseudouridine1911/1915/1917 synthase